MELKRRVGEDGRSYFYADEVFAPQPLLRAMVRGEPLEREAEKQRIREEIIAQEILRRRELEDEVWRELAVERDLALRQQLQARRLPLIDRMVSASRPLIQLPDIGVVQCDAGRLASRHEIRPVVPEVGEGRLVFLGKSKMNCNLADMKRKVETATFNEFETPRGRTNSNIAGMKRKAETVTVIDLSSAPPSPKRAQKVWRCDLCEVTTTSQQGLNDHRKGKKHKKKESKAVHLSKQKNKEAREEYYCQCCKISCCSEANLDDHLRGKKHLAGVRGHKDGDGAASSTRTSEDEEGIGDEDSSEYDE